MTESMLNLILPVGTQVVIRIELKGSDGRPVQPRGAVGEIVEAPTDNVHAYRVRFADGTESKLRRGDLSVRKALQKDPLVRAAVSDDPDLLKHVQLRVVIGSRAYGLAGEDSDWDRRGFYLPPADLSWSLWGVPEQLESDAEQFTYWELKKFVVLLLRANPGALEVLYSPLVEHVTPVAQRLIDMRGAFLSKLVFQTYSGYVLSQFKLLEKDVRDTGTVKWKHAMHLIRLLLAGIGAVRDGALPVDVGPYRERLLAIRRAEAPWDEVNAWRLALHREFNEAFAATKLPERPDYDAANRFLIEARRGAL